MKINDALIKKLQPIKALALDCDGILSNCQIYYLGEKQWGRQFSIRDGWGIKKLQSNDLAVTVITASKSEDIRERMKSLAIDPWYEGASEKIASWEKFLKHYNLKDHEVAYMGDDEPDLPLLHLAGFSATASDALPLVLESVDYVSQFPGGNGAVREICDLILKYKS